VTRAVLVRRTPTDKTDTVGRPPSRAIAASGRIQPSSRGHSSAFPTTRGFVSRSSHCGDLAGSRRARQPPSSHPARQERGRHAHPVRHCRVQPPRMGTPPRYSVKYGGIDAFNARMTAEKEHLSLSAVRRQLEDPSPAHRLHPERARRSAQPRDALRGCLRLDTYGHYPQHAEAIRQWRRRRTVDPRAVGSLPRPGAQ
jgi:hypothetical protein